MVYQRLTLSAKVICPGMLLISCLPSWNCFQSTWCSRHHLMVKFVTCWSLVRDQPRSSRISVILSRTAKWRKGTRGVFVAYTRALSVQAKKIKLSTLFFRWNNSPSCLPLERCPWCFFSAVTFPLPMTESVIFLPECLMFKQRCLLP